MWLIFVFIVIMLLILNFFSEQNYKHLETEVWKKFGFANWNVVSYFDEHVTVKSRQTLEKYDAVKFFKENKEKLNRAEKIIEKKNNIEKR